MIDLTPMAPEGTVPVLLSLSPQAAKALQCIAMEKGRTQSETVERWITAYAVAKEKADVIMDRREGKSL